MGSASSALKKLSLEDDNNLRISEALALVKKFDTNRDGVLDREEAETLFRAWAERRGLTDPADVASATADAVSHFDRNNDGQISICELLNIPDAYAAFVSGQDPGDSYGSRGKRSKGTLAFGVEPDQPRVHSLAAVPDTEHVVASTDGGLFLFDAEKREVVRRIAEGDFFGVAVSKSGYVFAVKERFELVVYSNTLDEDQDVKVSHDLRGKVVLATGDEVELSDPVLALDPASGDIVAAGKHGVVVVFDGGNPRAGTPTRSFVVEGKIADCPTAIAVVGGNLLIGSSMDSCKNEGIVIVSLANGSTVHTGNKRVKGPTGWVFGAGCFYILDKNGTGDIEEYILRIISADGKVEAMNTPAKDIDGTHYEVSSGDQHFGWGSCAASTPGGRIVLGSGYQRMVYFW